MIFQDPWAENCPHPASRKSCTVQVKGGRRAMNLCLTCKLTFERLMDSWAGGTIRPSQVIAAVLKLGYSRRDAAYFLLQLCTGSVRTWLHIMRAA